MWIKKTAVKTKSGNYTYIQLVQSERVEGKTRHKVIANLGRLDKLDLEQVNAFVHAVTSGTGDSFKLEQIRLLPSKNYGASLILGHMLESLGIQRFLTDLAIYKKMDPDVVNGIFALLVYYSVSEDSSLAFSDFLNRSFLPFSDSIDQKLLVSSLHLLADSSIIRASLLNCAQPDFPLYHYVYYSVNDNLKKISESGVILIVLDSGYVPVDFQSLKYHYPNYSLRSPDDVFVSDNLSLLKKCESFCLESGRYICKLHRKDVTELFKDSGSILSYAASRGQFREYKGLGYRSKNFEGKTVVILRPAPGIAGRITAGQPEPREILVSSLILLSLIHI